MLKAQVTVAAFCSHLATRAAFLSQKATSIPKGPRPFAIRLAQTKGADFRSKRFGSNFLKVSHEAKN